MGYWCPSCYGLLVSLQCMLHATCQSCAQPLLHPSVKVRQGGLITGTSLDNSLIPKPKIPGGDLAGSIDEDTGKVQAMGMPSQWSSRLFEDVQG